MKQPRGRFRTQMLTHTHSDEAGTTKFQKGDKSIGCGRSILMQEAAVLRVFGSRFPCALRVPADVGVGTRFPSSCLER